MKAFKELYLAEVIAFSAIDDYSYEWSVGDDDNSMAQYLGLNVEEEDAWISGSKRALKKLLDAQKDNYKSK